MKHQYTNQQHIMYNIKKANYLVILIATCSLCHTLRAVNRTELNPYGIYPIPIEYRHERPILKGATPFWVIVDKNPIPQHCIIKNSKVVLIWGEIGIGKTTLTYYLSGVPFTREGRHITTTNQAVQAKIDAGFEYDKTRMFEIVASRQHSIQRDWLYIDFPGFVNMHNDQQQLYNAFSFRLCLSRVPKIHAILFCIRCDQGDRQILQQVDSFYKSDLKHFLREECSNISYYKKHLFCILTRFENTRLSALQRVQKLFINKAITTRDRRLKTLLSIFATPGHIIAIDPCDDDQVSAHKTSRYKLEQCLNREARAPLTQDDFNMDFFSQGDRMKRIKHQIVTEVHQNEIMRVIHEYYDKYNKAYQKCMKVYNTYKDTSYAGRSFFQELWRLIVNCLYIITFGNLGKATLDALDKQERRQINIVKEQKRMVAENYKNAQAHKEKINIDNIHTIVHEIMPIIQGFETPNNLPLITNRLNVLSTLIGQTRSKAYSYNEQDKATFSINILQKLAIAYDEKLDIYQERKQAKERTTIYKKEEEPNNNDTSSPLTQYSSPNRKDDVDILVCNVYHP